MSFEKVLSAEQKNEINDILNDDNKNDHEQLSDFLESQNQNSEAVKNAKEKLKNLKNATSGKLKEVFLDKIEFGAYEKYKASIDNIAIKYNLPKKLFVRLLNKENDSANIFRPAGGSQNDKYRYVDSKSWKSGSGAYGLGQVTPDTFDSIYNNYLKGNSDSKNKLKNEYLGIGIKDEEVIVNTQLEFSAAYTRAILDKYFLNDNYSIGEVLAYYNSGINFNRFSKSDVSQSYVKGNWLALNNKEAIAKGFEELNSNSRISNKDYFDRIAMYYGGEDYISTNNYISSIEKQIGGKAVMGQFLDNAFDTLGIDKREKNIGSLGTMSILDVVGGGYSILNIFGAIMDGVSGNWGDMIQKLTIAYVGVKNMDYQLNGNVEAFEKKIDRLVEKTSKKGDIDGKNLKRILEKINDGENGNKLEGNNILTEYISNFISNDKNKRIQNVEKIQDVFSKVDFNKIREINGEITENNISDIIGEKTLNGIPSNLKTKIVNLMNLIKRDGIQNYNEFNAVNEYVLFNFNSDIAETIFKQI